MPEKDRDWLLINVLPAPDNRVFRDLVVEVGTYSLSLGYRRNIADELPRERGGIVPCLVLPGLWDWNNPPRRLVWQTKDWWRMSLRFWVFAENRDCSQTVFADAVEVDTQKVGGSNENEQRTLAKLWIFQDVTVPSQFVFHISRTGGLKWNRTFWWNPPTERAFEMGILTRYAWVGFSSEWQVLFSWDWCAFALWNERRNIHETNFLQRWLSSRPSHAIFWSWHLGLSDEIET